MRRLYPLALCLAACASDPELAATDEPINTCPLWGCGENSPSMGPYNYHELNLNGLINDAGVSVLDFTLNGKSYQPKIVGARLAVIDSYGNVVKGTGLTGGWFNLKTPTGVFRLMIEHVSIDPGQPYWVGTIVQNETYELWYDGPGILKLTPVCNNPPDAVNGVVPAPDDPGHTYNSKVESLLFTGDRYNAATKTVIATGYSATAGWMNIACAGSAIAKLHLNRHTTAGSPGPGGITTTWQQRQALLKMFVSDDCGTGESFTTKGTPLDWANSVGWTHMSDTDYAHEAMWNETGALCLDVDRLGSTVYQQIQQTCPKPACPLRWPTNAYLSSAVPFPVN